MTPLTPSQLHDAAMQASQQRIRSILFYLRCAQGIGTALAMFVAPPPTKKTNGDLTRRVGTGLKKGRDDLEAVLRHLESKFRETLKIAEKRLTHLN